MTDPQPETEIPLAYANVRSPATQQLMAIKQAIFATSLLAAVLGLLPGTQLLLREASLLPDILIMVVGVLSYLTLVGGALLGLLRMRAGKWVTIFGLVIISLEVLLGFVAGVLGLVSQEFGRLGFWTCYMYYGLPTLWALAFSILAIIVLTRSDSPTRD